MTMMFLMILMIMMIIIMIEMINLKVAFCHPGDGDGHDDQNGAYRD